LEASLFFSHPVSKLPQAGSPRVARSSPHQISPSPRFLPNAPGFSFFFFFSFVPRPAFFEGVGSPVRYSPLFFRFFSEMIFSSVAPGAISISPSAKDSADFSLISPDSRSSSNSRRDCRPRLAWKSTRCLFSPGYRLWFQRFDLAPSPRNVSPSWMFPSPSLGILFFDDSQLHTCPFIGPGLSFFTRCLPPVSFTPLSASLRSPEPRILRTLSYTSSPGPVCEAVL